MKCVLFMYCLCSCVYLFRLCTFFLLLLYGCVLKAISCARFDARRTVLEEIAALQREPDERAFFTPVPRWEDVSCYFCCCVCCATKKKQKIEERKQKQSKAKQAKKSGKSNKRVDLTYCSASFSNRNSKFHRSSLQLNVS